MRLLPVLAFAIACQALVTACQAKQAPPPPAAAGAPEPAGPPGCGVLGERVLGEPLPLLSGHLQVRALQGAVAHARSSGLMSAATSNDVETRLFLEQGGQKQVVLIEELMALADADFVSRAGDLLLEQMTPNGGTLDHFTTQGGLRVVSAAPASYDLSTEAVMVLAALVAHPDETVQFVVFYVNPAVLPVGIACTDLAQTQLRTLRPGGRVADRSGRDELLDIWSDRASLSIALPADYSLSVDQGPDFRVYRVSKLQPLGALSAQLGIYVGDHPSGSGDSADTVQGTLLGEPVQWQRTIDQDGAHHLEAMAGLAVEGAPSTAHVFMSAPADLIDEVRQIAESLSVEARAPIGE